MSNEECCVKCGEIIPLTERAMWDLSGAGQHRHMHCLPADLRAALDPHPLPSPQRSDRE